MANKKNVWDEKTFTSKGDSLYRAQVSGSPVFDKEFPGISRFDKEGQTTDEYILRGLTDGKVERSGLDYTYSGTNIKGGLSKGSSNRDNLSGETTPLQSYYNEQYRDLEKGWSTDDQSNFFRATSEYGEKPRYSQSGKLVTPHQLFGKYRELTKGMEWKEKFDFNSQYSNYVKMMSTDKPTVDDKAFDMMKKSANE